MPAKAGIQDLIPACAGMTGSNVSSRYFAMLAFCASVSSLRRGS